jgi:hypothetical protein
MDAQRSRFNRRRGAGLVYVVFGAFAVTTGVAMMMTMSMSSSRATAIERFERRARYLAKGAVNVATRDLTGMLASERGYPTSGMVRIDGHEVTYEVRPTGEEREELTSTGLRAVRSGYEIAASATVTGTEYTEYQGIEVVSVPLFQFGAFHTGDLELYPDGDFTLDGRIHANGHLYLNSGGTLTLDTNQLTAGGHLYRDRKGGLEPRSGAVRVRRWVADPSDPREPVEFAESPSQLAMAALGIATTSGFDSNFTRGFDAAGDGDFADEDDWRAFGRAALERWSEPAGYGRRGRTLRTRSHGVPSVSAPERASIALDGYFHRNAGLAVITQPDLSFRILDGTGADVTDAFPDTVEVSELFDARQAGTTMAKVLVTRIDLGRLAELGGFPENGLIYAAWSGSGPDTRARGVVLAGGAQLPAPLTVASDNSLYVQGDYNSVDSVPAALICDAFNVLSNAWDGSKEHSQLPRAAPTTCHAALLTGDIATSGASYGGGLLNLARLHEDWADVALTLRGSFVRGWESKYATGRWASGGHHYVSPERDITYETGFDEEGGMPPFAPSAVTAMAKSAGADSGS